MAKTANPKIEIANGVVDASAARMACGEDGLGSEASGTPKLGAGAWGSAYSTRLMRRRRIRSVGHAADGSAPRALSPCPRGHRYLLSARAGNQHLGWSG